MCFSNLLIRAVFTALAAILLAGCGGGGGSSVSVSPSLPVENNVLAITVDSGPANTGYNVNRLYATVKVCQPGTTTCQTIDHVLVDTGSSGLRLLSSAMDPALNLKRQMVTSVLPLLNCAQFVDDTFVWGPVATADVLLGGEMAARVPIQIIADPSRDAVFSRLAAACSSGTEMNTAATLGANGIIGLALFKEDCGSSCVMNAANGFYYTCTDASCTATKGETATLAQQVKNPVPLFVADSKGVFDNNGVLIDLPAVSTTTAASLRGSLIFGIGTQANNRPELSAVLPTNSLGYITTLLAGQNLPDKFTNSFIDTGSNGLFFDSTITKCGTSADGFYCPMLPVNLSAKLVAANAVRTPVSFSVDNALALFTSYPNAVLPALAGPIGHALSFDWGLPFFYGRRVFIGIEGQPSTLGTGPFYAF